MILLLILLLAPAAVAQHNAREEPDYAFLVNSPYLEGKGTMQIISAGGITTRRGHPEMSFPSTFFRTEWGLTDRWELDLMANGAGTDFLTRADSLVGIRYNLMDESRGQPFSFSVGPQVLLPTGHEDLSTSLGRVGYAWDVTAGKDFGGPIFTYYSLNYAATPRPDFVLNALNWGFCLGIRPLEHDTRGRRHHDVHLYAEYSGTRADNVDSGRRTTANTAALALGFRYGYQTPYHTLFEIGASAPIGLTHDSPNYGWIIQFQYEVALPWHPKHTD